MKAKMTIPRETPHTMFLKQKKKEAEELALKSRLDKKAQEIKTKLSEEEEKAIASYNYTSEVVEDQAIRKPAP